MMENKYLRLDYLPKINLDEFYYELPKDRIAEFPLENRSESKLLFAETKTKNITHHKFFQLPELIPPDSLIIFNTTKVIPARLMMKKPTGGLVELLLIEPVSESNLDMDENQIKKIVDPQISLNKTGSSYWLCIIGGKRVNEGLTLSLKFENKLNLNAEIKSRHKNEAIVNFSWTQENITFSEVLTQIGKVPLPPYINREVKLEDKKWYQTVYAQSDGSVAAPTAGFHFTDEIIEQLKQKNINIDNVVLHVGPGTFKPIDVDNVTEHEMHSERISISKNTLENIIQYIKKTSSQNESQFDNNCKRIIATGTTTLRTLESLYWIGCKIILNKNVHDIHTLNQWEAYEIANNNKLPTDIESLESILKFMAELKLEEFTAKTSLFIIPGYEFKIVNGIITNYHLPKSTLILLIAAFAGKEFWKKIYDSALNNDYRFLSYGDSSLITNYEL